MTYDDIWVPLQNGLETFLGIPVIQAEGLGKQPPYPFIAIKFTLFGQGVGQVSEKLEGTNKVITQALESVISVTCYAERIEDAHNKTNQARNYFLGQGHYELSDHNITVVDVMPANNRDVFLTTDYERRAGFDVRLRTKLVESFEVGVIEQVTINERMEE